VSFEHDLPLEPDLTVDGDCSGEAWPTNPSFPPGCGFLVDRGSFELVQLARTR
jgi:hypothetical protein